MGRLGLHDELCDVLGSSNVYFQPPTNVAMSYPAIVYSRHRINKTYADNAAYRINTAYTVTLIGHDPDSPTVYKLAAMPLSRQVRHYVADNLNHDVYTIVYEGGT